MATRHSEGVDYRLIRRDDVVGMVELKVHVRLYEDGTFQALAYRKGMVYEGEGTEVVSALTDMALAFDEDGAESILEDETRDDE